MTRGARRSANRDGSQFVALPHVVLDSLSYQCLSFSARSLLVDLARQFSGSNNGKLVLCDKALKPRGWKSSATIHKAKRELLQSSLIYQTRQGYKPNKASWFAVTWLSLDWLPEMDIARNNFPRGAYLDFKIRPPKSGAHISAIASNSETGRSPDVSKNEAMHGNLAEVLG